jgi:ssDNA-binding Zn-finger/Zn-ribbon topoisomerase 1
MSTENGQLAVLPNQVAIRDRFLPVLDADDVLKRHAALCSFRERVLKPSVDYGVIPGTGDKLTLLKPGAEKLCTLFGLTTRFQIVQQVEDWSGSQHDGEPFFYYLYRCQLWRGEHLIAEADGSANSRETKYRWRKSERVCPECGKATIIKGKAEYGGGYLCFARKGGCGAKFKNGDPAIESQVVGRVPNPDIADAVNTLQKMSQKRALVAATLIGVNASEFFTQDIEDFAHNAELEPAETQTQSEERSAQPQQTHSSKRSAGDEPAPQKTINLCDEWFQYVSQNGFKDAEGQPARRIARNATRRQARDYLKCFEAWEDSRQAKTEQPQSSTQNVSTQQDANNAVEGEVVENPGQHPEPNDKRWAELHSRFQDSTAYADFCAAAAEKKIAWGVDTHVAALESEMERLHDMMFIAEDMEAHDWEEAATAIRDGQMSWTGDGTPRIPQSNNEPVQEAVNESSEQPGTTAEPAAAPA